MNAFSRRFLRRDDQGTGTVQLPLMAGTYVAFIMLLIFVGRVNSGYSTAEIAARSAARTIAIARDPAAAVEVARQDAETIVNVGSAKCRSMDFSHIVTATEVTVTVTCAVGLEEVSIVSVPAEWTATATATEPVDRWREIPGGFENSEGSSGSNSRVGGG